MKRLALLVAVLALVAAACGGSSEAGGVASLSGDTDTTSAGDDADPAEIDQEEAVIALTECLREQGVDLEDPSVDSDGNVRLGQPDLDGIDDPREVLGEAFEACEDSLDGVVLGFGRPDDTEIQDTLYEFAACMRDNGYDMPDPDFSSFGPGGGDGSADGEGGVRGPLGDLDLDDPAFQAAQGACEDILAGFGPGGGRLGGAGRGGDDG